MVKGQTFTLEAVLTTVIVFATVFYLTISFPLTTPKSYTLDEIYVCDVFNLIGNGMVKLYGGAISEDFNRSFTCSTRLGYYLRILLDNESFAYNIYVAFISNGTKRELKFIYDGVPPPNSILLSMIVPIYDWDKGLNKEFYTRRV
ncbi:MAG: hypothetical protein DRP01_09105 [Archaeoglobales archaeon]|nr:MAG: hypothetical protein DRP01_09105 [Archaeoglobales archaeon]